MMMRTAADTAILIATVIKRSAQPRARVSAQTVKLLAGRKRLRGAFIVEVIVKLEDYGFTMCELPRGGFGVIKTETLEGAKAVTAKRYLEPEELHGLRSGQLSSASFQLELETEEPPEDSE